MTVWLALVALGCFHGINPGMGWLFAVALGLQEKSSRALFLALPPIALGHIVSISGVVALAALAQISLPAGVVRIAAAAMLFAFGLYRLVRARHIGWVGMRVGFWGLAAWSFLMASGHGAGLMLLPFVTGSAGLRTMHSMAAASVPVTQAPGWIWVAMVLVHTFAYLTTMLAVAWIVFDRLGVRMLRAVWFNFDFAWAVALVVSGILVLVL